jgi:two-component system OmpR family sensor kinase
MSSRAWYRSLYWRIGLGFVLSLTALLVAQVALTFWVIGRAEEAVPEQPLAEYAALVATDIGSALEADPNLDLDQHLKSRYGAMLRPTFVVMADGRVAGGRWGRPPDQIVEAARDRLARPMPPPVPDATGRRGRAGRLGMFLPFGPFTPIFVNGERVGMVIVQPRRPPEMVFREIGPLMGAVALVLITGGGVLAALLIFGPAHRRLRGLEEAARDLGRGERSARAPEAGGDEISSVALSFNQMADDLDRRASELAASDRARRQLLADVSHELTTPLTAIRGYVETLAMPDLALDEAARMRYLGIVGDETMKLERIVGDLLELAKLEAGGITLRVQDVPITDLFARVASRHERLCQERQLTLTTTIEAGAETVRADPDRLEQVLQNLAANALRHSTTGGRIDLVASADDGTIIIDVRDTGSGIAPEHLPFIFDRFYKTEAARSDEAAGSGLGLSIVKAIVRRHGGTVTATSNPGVETVFRVRLPAPESEDHPPTGGA